jgi:transposase
MPKPHRVVLDRVSGYADEASAFMRRRRHVRRPFARVYRADGSSVDHAAESETGAALIGAAGRLLELAVSKEER